MTNVIQNNKTWRPSGALDIDLAQVRFDASYAGSSNCAVIFANCSGRIGRLEVEVDGGGRYAADGVHVGSANHDLVIESFSVYVHDCPSSALHWDAIQITGGTNITFRNGLIIQRNPLYDTEGRAVIFSKGQSTALTTDVVFENCYMESHRDPVSTKTQVFSQAESLRCGLRGCFIAQAHAGGSPVWQKSDAQDPVEEMNTIIPNTVPVPLHP